ncbi:MAG: nicotinate-nucleotide adenylyltransferase [Halioglobus sp.]
MIQTNSTDAPVGVFGGTFDPVHNGHLRSALELMQRFSFDQLRMMPCADPSHRDAPDASAEHRAAMLELAIQGSPGLLCDRRELGREGPSYTVDSLIEIRKELGDERSICLIMGCDAVLNITSWHRWNELLEFANIVVIARPGWHLPSHGRVSDWLSANACADREALHSCSAGLIRVEELRPLPISASEIRRLFADGHSARFLLPDAVIDYIANHGLYI